MCYDRRARRRQHATEEQSSHGLWDLFHRETAEPAEPREPEIRLDTDEREGVEEQQPAPAER
jgi:hypothetical protein